MRSVSVALLLALAACSRRPATRPAEPVSVLLVTIDTLRADRVGAYGDAQARTLHLDRLAREGTLFEAAFAPAPITLASHATILTGLLPPANGVRGNGSFVLGPTPRTLAECLRARGLRTAAFVGAFPLARRFGLDRGFEHYDDALEKAPGVHYEFAERPADRVVAAARAWLGSHHPPVFVWVHLFDPHAPYDPPEAFRQSDPYRGEVAFADSSLGPLLADWDGRPGTSVVAVTGDHGEAFGEHGEESHSLFVYDTTLRVPLVLRGAGVPRGRRAREPVSLADLGATLLSLVPGRSDGLPGRNLLDGSKPGPLYAETLAPRLDFGWSDLRAWRDGRYKYIRAPRPELYDLAADSGETQNLAAREPALARRMAEALERALADMGDHESERPVEPDAAGRLHTLGYVQGPGGRGSGADPKDMLPVALRIARAGGPFPDHAAAVRAYREILALDPRNPLVTFRLADALLRSGHAAEAMEFFRTVVASGPRTADAHLGLAIACARLGRLEEASRVLQQALVLDPRNGQVQYDLGEVARARGDTAGARARYEAALDDPVTRARALTRLAELR